VKDTVCEAKAIVCEVKAIVCEVKAIVTDVQVFFEEMGRKKRKSKAKDGRKKRTGIVFMRLSSG
jgi:hypothetical protein